MSVDKKLLKRLKVLYVEDDNHIRTELSSLLASFFGQVYTAQNGKEGLELYLRNKDEIDVILSDINMPLLNGIEMVKKIREFDKRIPVMFATAYSDNEFLSEAIKLRVYEYIIKPIDIRNLLSIMNTLANVLYQEFLIEQQTKELEKYKDVIDVNNIVIKTDISGNINYINNHLKDITGYELEDLKGKNISCMKHPDMAESIFVDMINQIRQNEIWKGKIKSVTKFGDPFVVDCYTIPTINDAGEITGALSVQRDITVELNKNREIKIALMKDKGKIFLEGKENIAEMNIIINELNNRIDSLQQMLKQSELEKDRIIYNTEKYEIENKTLRNEVAQNRKNAEFVEDKSQMTLKMNKEIIELRQRIKAGQLETKKLLEECEKAQLQKVVNLEVKADDLEKELSECKKKLEDVGDSTAFSQKLEYWKEKAKEEAKRAEDLERRIMQHGDTTFMKKIFGK